MNIILLLFIILSAMFISSSVHNLVTVSTALPDYFRMSGLEDYTAGAISDGVSRADISPAMDFLKNVDGYETEPQFFVSRKENLEVDGKREKIPVMICSSFDRRLSEYYGEDNRQLTEVREGEVFLNTSLRKLWNAEPGDRVSISLAGVEKDFILGGYMKDAMFNPEFISTKRILMNDADFRFFYEDPAILPYTGSQAMIKSPDVGALQQEIADLDPGFRINYHLPVSKLASAYIMDVLTTVILLVFSLFIVILSLVILNFTIRFSIEEEFREIGVMKAIGLPQNKTRWMYVTKYTGLSVLGSIIGLLLGIPFGSMMMRAASANIVILSGGNYLINILAAAAVAGLIILFSYHCAGRMKKYTPMDAIRSGETGERFRKKGKIHLSSSKAPVPAFLAANDVLSNPRRYGVMLLAFTLSLILVVMLNNTANTLNSPKLAKMMGVQESDLYLSADVLELDKVMAPGGKAYLSERLKEIEEELKGAGVPCKVHAEAWVEAKLQKDDFSTSTIGFYGMGTDMEDYAYLEGSAPQSPDEIALTAVNAQRLGVSVGDTVLCNGRECLVTATFDCFNNLGDSMRFYPEEGTEFGLCQGMADVQVTFTDDPDEETWAAYKQKALALYPDGDVKGPEEFIAKSMGDSAPMVTGLKNLAVVIVILVSVFTVVLMERSFISRGKNEIALLKAVGFRNGGLSLWHSLRILLVMLAAAVLSLLLSGPLTRLCIGPIFVHMGTTQIEFDTNPMENYLYYPLVMIAFTVAADWLTAQFMRKITAMDTSNIE
ncbi:MAG: FtsX-like permease family protein [Candidatus Limivicinus sp.]